MAIESVSVYLLKPMVTSAAVALKEQGRDLDQHAINAGETVGNLFVQQGEEGPPAWVGFLAGSAAPPLAYRSRSHSAVLILRAAGRWFAITFGQARHLLEPTAYERDFGLRVAINGVDPDLLRGAEARTFNEHALHTLRQLSRLSSIESLELDQDRDLVVSMAGQLADPDIGRRIDGRDAARLTADMTPSNLAAKCEELLRLSTQSTYRDNFPFLDTIKSVRDPDEIARLNARAFNALGQRQFGRFDLFPPEIVSGEIVAFRFSPGAQSLTTVSEPTSALLRYPLSGPTAPDEVLTKLRRYRLRGIDSNGEIAEEWTFWDCLHWEFPEQGATFVLDGGRWYRIDASLTGEVDAFVQTLNSSTLSWPAAGYTEHEGPYNERAAKFGGHALVDKKLIRLANQTGVEPCDIFTRDRHFVHVKRRKGGSGPLSHLFAQALVSAECFVMDLDWRRQLRQTLESVETGFGKYSPDTIDAREYTIVLALIVSSNAPSKPISDLPFFTKVMLRLTVRRLRAMGFKVFVDAIPTRVTVPTGLPMPLARRQRARGGRPAVAAKGAKTKP